MVKHLFGAISSPSVATFCPRQTALLNQEGFETKVDATVKRNMYADDMMKSISATKKQSILASQLHRKKLEKSGFCLTKWCSNDREVQA